MIGTGDTNTLSSLPSNISVVRVDVEWLPPPPQARDMSTVAGIQGRSEGAKIAVAVEGTKQRQSRMRQGGGE